MRILVVLLLAVATAQAGSRFNLGGATNFAAARINAQAVRIASLEKLLERVGERIDQAAESNIPARQRDLTNRVTELEPEICESNEFHCGEDQQCVSKLLCCDGTNDCTNGQDEDAGLCATPVATGSRWTADVHWDACRVGEDGAFSIVITTFKQWDYFPAMAYLEAKVHDEKLSEDYNTKGYFVYGGKQVVLLPPDDDRLDDRLGLNCHFVDRFTADCDILTESALTVCAHVTLTRE